MSSAPSSAFLWVRPPASAFPAPLPSPSRAAGLIERLRTRDPALAEAALAAVQPAVRSAEQDEEEVPSNQKKKSDDSSLPSTRPGSLSAVQSALLQRLQELLFQQARDLAAFDEALQRTIAS
jgi:hypothetical protein